MTLSANGEKCRCRKNRNTIKELTSRTEELENNANGPKMAFLATMGTVVSVPAESTVKFDTVVTNVGNGYNINDGMFSVQYDGIYLFSAAVMTFRNGTIQSYFSLNGKMIAMIYASTSDGLHDQAANTVILQLQKNDRVCVVSRHTANIIGSNYSSFSGTLL